VIRIFWIPFISADAKAASKGGRDILRPQIDAG